MSDYHEFIAGLVELGEAKVRANLAQGIWANRRKSWAERWLHDEELKLSAATKVAGVSSAREANAIAQSSLNTARSAKTAAWVAALSVVIAAVVALLVYFGIKA